MPKFIHVESQFASKLAQAAREAMADIKKGALLGLGSLIVQKLYAMGVAAFTKSSKGDIPQGHSYHKVDE